MNFNIIYVCRDYQSQIFDPGMANIQSYILFSRLDLAISPELAGYENIRHLSRVWRIFGV